MPMWPRKRKSADALSSGEGGMSEQGRDVRSGEMEFAKEEARGRANMEKMNKPDLNGLADGGEVEESGMDDEAIDNELGDMLAEELSDALERKDKRAILESLRALVLNCKE
jgi:hypothetical protein